VKRDGKKIDGLRELIQLLGMITTTHESLLSRINEKIDAVKRADLEALRSATLAEQKLVEEVEKHNGIRRLLMDRVGMSLGFGPAVGRTMTVGQILERLADEPAEALTLASARLRGVMVRVSQANRAAGTICAAMLGHLSAVFTSATSSGREATSYSNRGGLVATHEARIIEAVG
jgi:hypothetical protein